MDHQGAEEASVGKENMPDLQPHRSYPPSPKLQRRTKSANALDQANFFDLSMTRPASSDDFWAHDSQAFASNRVGMLTPTHSPPAPLIDFNHSHNSPARHFPADRKTMSSQVHTPPASPRHPLQPSRSHSSLGDKAPVGYRLSDVERGHYRSISLQNTNYYYSDEFLSSLRQEINYQAPGPDYTRNIYIELLSPQISLALVEPLFHDFGTIQFSFSPWNNPSDGLVVMFFNLNDAKNAFDTFSASPIHNIGFSVHLLSHEATFNCIHGTFGNELSRIPVNTLNQGILRVKGMTNRNDQSVLSIFQYFGGIRSLWCTAHQDSFFYTVEFWDTRSAERAQQALHLKMVLGDILSVQYDQSRTTHSSSFFSTEKNLIRMGSVNTPFHNLKSERIPLRDANSRVWASVEGSENLVLDAKRKGMSGFSTESREYLRESPDIQSLTSGQPTLKDYAAKYNPNMPLHNKSSKESKENELDLYNIAMGVDTRTTFMIRNIPNKYTQQMLISFLNKTHKGQYDFLYLRMDFKNRCNVGYAFINFSGPPAVLSFAERVVGKKWSKFNSDKVCTLSYANVQGKRALIQKFRNSSVMLEDPSYRPKIFYTSGLLCGEEEPFPEPTTVIRPRSDVLFSRDNAGLPHKRSNPDFGSDTGSSNRSCTRKGAIENPAVDGCQSRPSTPALSGDALCDELDFQRLSISSHYNDVRSSAPSAGPSGQFGGRWNAHSTDGNTA
ncbi:RNA recognition motif 2-domain-containing protein [Phlyctochytrium arcticum]|nr:RNA recognition motif 2-domain-containing protein [Phlyctochytrium arcticum]